MVLLGSAARSRDRVSGTSPPSKRQGLAGIWAEAGQPHFWHAAATSLATALIQAELRLQLDPVARTLAPTRGAAPGQGGRQRVSNGVQVQRCDVTSAGRLGPELRPLPFGDHLDGAVFDLEGRLIVDGVGRDADGGGPPLCVSQGSPVSKINGTGHPVTGSDLAGRALLDHDHRDDQPGSGHRRSVRVPPPARPRCPLCLETPVLDVLSMDTIPRRSVTRLTFKCRPPIHQAPCLHVLFLIVRFNVEVLVVGADGDGEVMEESFEAG
jgi:hypothetical protein